MFEAHAIADMVAQDFGTLPAMIGRQAAVRPDHVALVHGERQLTCSELDALIDRVAAGLQRNAVKPQDVVAVCASSSAEYVAVFMGALRAGVAVAPLAPSSTPASLATMIADSGACLLFLDHMVAQSLVRVPDRIAARHIALDGSAAGEAFEAWLPPAGTRPDPVEIQPDWPFNIIYSSGTTGAPKGIVHSHAIRWQHIRRGIGLGYGPNAVTLISIPLYSNTTLVSLIPALAGGGTVVLMDKFEVVRFLEQAQSHRATHTMLVPVQYRRLMEHPDFDRYDLSSFQMKFSTSAPFSAAVKAEVLKRWPGGLMEFYGMTEGGAGFVLAAHEHPDKLHTVGRPVPDADIRLIDEEGREVPVGAIGEVVGHSPSMMNGYHNQPGKTAEVEWRDATGKRFIRTGDVGRLDEDGFLILMDRRKDMIISGGFNIYPSDLEAVLTSHEAVAEAAVVGVPSNRWGETPIALVVLNAGTVIDAEDLRIWANERVGKMQRLHALQILSALPRSAIGKVLKRELRDQYAHLASE